MTALKKITTQAKKIRKKHPGKSWKAAIKMAGQQYRSGKIAGVRRKKSTAKKRRKVSGVKRRVRSIKPKRVTGMVGSIAQHKAAAKKLIAEKLGWLDVQIMTAKKAGQKKNLQNRRAQYMKEARALS
jgi:hypothetical protein